MSTQIQIPSAFKIKRPLTTGSGFATGVDPTVKSHLNELNQLLGKRVLAKGTGTKGAESVAEFFARPLTPKRVPPGGAWADKSLARFLADAKEEKDGLTLAELIDATAELVDLKYEFQDQLSKALLTLDYNTRAVLESYPNVSDYLVAYAFKVLKLRNVNALNSFVRKNDKGARSFVNYAVVSAARTLINDEQLSVAEYNDDDGALAKALRASTVSLSSAFKKAAKAIIENFVFNTDEIALIDGSSVGPVPAKIKPLVVKYIQAFAIPITAKNVDFYLPVFISQAMKSQGMVDPEDSALDLQDQDFNVQFREDDDARVSDVSRSAIRCAAQLYHGMVIGDELDVFGVINYFTHKYLIRGSLEIRDKRLRSDLRLYVFSDKFIDLGTNRVMDRTRQPERQMFFRQVFSEGNAEVTEDVIINPDFKRLWKVMVLESAKYLQRAQASFNPDSFVSRQNVMQAVEDLQYNLSTNCTGMVNIIAPLIDAELNFVLSRILKHPEVIQHVVPSGGTWQRVVETLSSGMKRTRPRATTLYNKGRLGEGIIRSIAEYTPSSFEDDQGFSAFISQVDAFITTQSILQDSLASAIADADADAEEGPDAEADEYPEEGTGPIPPSRNNGAGAVDEWDF